MKKKQVTKLFSVVGMACVLAMSPCSMAGNIAYASEVQQENKTENPIDDSEKSASNDDKDTKDDPSDENKDTEKDPSDENKDTEKDPSDESKDTEDTSSNIGENIEDPVLDDDSKNQDESDKNIQKPSQDAEETGEETEEFAQKEETDKEITKKEAAVFSARTEDVELKSFYEGKEISFDSSKDWSDKGEQQLELTSEQPLKSGAKVSFDLYIPAEKAEYSGAIKVQGVARLGSDWTWTENKSISEFGASDFTEEVTIDGESYKKVNVSYCFGDEITKDYLATFTVKIAGYQCTYEGPVKYANVQLEDGKDDTNTDEEQITLDSYSENALSFDRDSEWDANGLDGKDLGLSSDQPLKSGTKVSLDLYIPTESADYEGTIKVQGIARLGSDWTWTENKSIPEFGAADFKEEVTIDGKSYKTAKVSFTFGDEITTDYLANFTIKLAGYHCDYHGMIYYDNVKLEEGTSQPEQPGEGVLKVWDFASANDFDGWYHNDNDDYQNQGANSVEWNEQYQALAVKVDYSKDADVSWSEIKVSYWKDDFATAGVNTMNFDFIYDPNAMTKGSFKIKLFSNGGDKVETDAVVNTDASEDYADGLKVVHFTVDFDSADIAKNITIGVVGCETDYQGVIFLDNITLRKEAKQQAEDIYVDAKVDVTGQQMALSVQGNTLNTGAGNSSIATAITLADGNATDSAKQVYAYLQAVGNTDSVIFGQQNNTSHKAGNSNLSCSDTMDVVGSYAGVIGLDGLALVGDEYSAERYLNEMQSLDSAYSSVSGQIAAASTPIEKNVIAAAALTNYNIRNGAIATLSLHMPNFSLVDRTGAAGGPSYAAYNFTGYTPNNLTGDVMNQILPGGAYNDAFTAYLDMVADYAHHVDGAVLFRPFHENTGSWFWWGAAFCDAPTYKSVYKYTVEYLRDEKNVHNFLYVYGPGSEASSMEEYAARYPGDGYVDMVGFDMYHSNPTEGDTFIANFSKELSIVEGFANAHGKLVAVTETGAARDAVEGDNQTALLKQGNERRDWYREILDVVKKSNASYYLVWANFSEKDGFYTPYVKSVKEDKTKHGHEMMDDFIRFFNEDSSIFAINQQQALNQIQSLSIRADAAIDKSGYIVSPVSGSRVLDQTTLRAKVTGIDAADQITFVCKGSEETKTVEAQIADGYASAVLTKSDLQSLGESVGEISLVINGTTFDTVRALFNIGEAERDPYEIDGFENYYGVDDMLTNSWSMNKASGSSITLSLSKDYSYEGDYVMKFAYTETSDGWAGATLSKEVDWTDCDALKFWTVPDGKLQKTVIQITAGDNTIYEYYLNENQDYAAMGTTPILVTIPFEKFVARDIPGNPTGGLVNDRAKITSVGLWVNAIADSDAFDNGMVSGVLYYDNITAVASGSSEVIVQRADSKPEEPERPSESSTSTTSSSDPSNRNTSSTNAAVNQVVQPSYTTKDQRKVSGWQEVVDAAYLDAEPTITASDAISQHRIANINITGVTELIIPRATVVTMQQKDADYNFYYQNIAITLSHNMLTEWTKDLDLEVFLRTEKDFGEGFDAFYIKKHANDAIPQNAIINILLSAEKAGRYAHIFGRNSQTTYELVSTVSISELGTISLLAGPYEEYIVLY